MRSTAQNMIVENDDVAPAIVLRRAPSRGEVMAEICRQLEPFQADDGRDITGATVIAKDLSIDSLAVMDMVMDLEDKYDVSIPMNVVAEIQTVNELADTILALSARR
ncbi:acyl carrier protein [Enhydrobacter sp.]|uniref:acyl carrier protein n=1 Tax=Enhydrobacter sp. TaxID=1894999 RepID=UPI0026066328|nr:acyl carrier protein [Enhydrobacter sp.]